MIHGNKRRALRHAKQLRREGWTDVRVRRTHDWGDLWLWVVTGSHLGTLAVAA